MHGQLSGDDLFLFNAGEHQQLYNHLGAHPSATGGTRFAVWAPAARAVAVIGDWNGWNAEASPLQSLGASGVWAGEVAAAVVGARYKYAITTESGLVIEKADPFAAYAEMAPRTGSIVWQASYQWQDAAWMQRRAQVQAWHQPMSIYEVHLGSWQRTQGAVLNYRELGVRLAAYALELGFTHVELMPVTEHPFYGSWGYQVTGYFAPTSRYGTPDDFAAMVDTLHQAGIGVIVDFVPAHFPTDAHGLGEFDGTHLFEHADPRRGFHPDWTSYIFNYGRHEVRSFLISAAMLWLDRYHVDGIRIDGVASMLYRDYSRKSGEWIPDADGSNHDREAVHFLQTLNRSIYGAYPDVHVFAEESTAWPGVTRSVHHGGLGFGFKWDMGWMHDSLAYLQHDPLYRQYHHHLLTFRAVYMASENYVLPLSHDEVVHGKGSLLAKMPGDRWQQFANVRLLLGYQWLVPGKKLLFMGGEFAAAREWHHERELDWASLADPLHAGVARWVHDLNRAYRGHPGLYHDTSDGGFAWLIADDTQASVFAFLRQAQAQARQAPLVVVVNATPVPRYDYRVGVPPAARWIELLNSDAAAYGGSNLGNLGEVQADAVPCRGYAQSVRLTLPPLSVVVLLGTAQLDDAGQSLPALDRSQTPTMGHLGSGAGHAAAAPGRARVAEPDAAAPVAIPDEPTQGMT